MEGTELTNWTVHLITAGFVAAWGVLLLRWTYVTGFGKEVLKKSPERRNKMTTVVPFIPLVIWILVMWASQSMVIAVLGDITGAKRAIADNLILGISAIIGAGIILFIAERDFVRGIKGFGLKSKGIAGDLWRAFVTLLAVWPLMVAAIYLTMRVGGLIWGEDFQMSRHRELNVIAEYKAPQLRALVFVVAVVIVPFFEEMLFRGMFQSMIRAYTRRVWTAIILCSIIFTTVHPNISHWAPLFILSMGLGYVYEKTGSLWTAVFMHAMFNGIAILSAIYAETGQV